MLDMTRVYSSLKVTGSQRKLELVLSFFWKVARSNSNVHDGWLCKDNGCEEVLYGKYGSCEHLLFLFQPSHCLTVLYVFDLYEKQLDRLSVVLLSCWPANGYVLFSGVAKPLTFDMMLQPFKQNPSDLKWLRHHRLLPYWASMNDQNGL